MRTPLNAILGYAQILKRDKRLNDQQITGLNTIRQSGDHLLTLITDLLDLAKIEAGKFDLSTSTVNLSSLLHVVVDITRVKAEQKGLRFQCIAPAELATVCVDEKRLRQVLLNLLGNATKFTDRGEVTLEVISTPIDMATTCLRFEVRDTGIGMRQDQLELIFQPFEQVGDAQRRHGGTGLGLSISRQLVRLMNGDIQVTTELGKGSMFSFELQVPLAANQAVLLPSSEKIIGYGGAPKSILIVDDIDANRAMLADLLSSLGFAISEANDGLQAVPSAYAQRPDLILMDIRMPGMDGLEATRRIRLNAELATIPVIAVSASASAEDEDDAIDAGVDIFMTKPIDDAQLLQHIGKLLQLTWDLDQPVATVEVPSTLTAPPQVEMTVLHALALEGNMRALRERAAHIATLDARFHAFAERLECLAKEYQSKAIMDLVKRHMEQAS